MSNTTIERIHKRKRTRAAGQGRVVFLVRTQSQMFDPQVVESVQQARESAIEILGDVVDWDCYECRHAVVTLRLSDNCPRCGGTGHTLGQQ